MSPVQEMGLTILMLHESREKEKRRADLVRVGLVASGKVSFEVLFPEYVPPVDPETALMSDGPVEFVSGDADDIRDILDMLSSPHMTLEEDDLFAEEFDAPS